MKAKVNHKFRDKYSGKVYFAGDEIEVTPERFEEINAAAVKHDCPPFVESAETADDIAPETTPEPETETAAPKKATKTKTKKTK